MWAAPGRDRATLAGRSSTSSVPTAARRPSPTFQPTGAGWIADVVADTLPHAVMCADPFHVDRLGHPVPRPGPPRGLEPDPPPPGGTVPAGSRAGRAPDAARRRDDAQARPLRTLEEPRNLTANQHDKLAWIAQGRAPGSPRLPAQRGPASTCSPSRARPANRPSSDGWPGPAVAASPPSSHLATTHRPPPLPRDPATLEHGLSNGLIESVNTKIRLITRVAFGFRSATALIALAMLSLGGHQPTLPGRPHPQIDQ